MSKNSLYETLEINKNASQDEVKKAYRKLARKYHPDVNSDAGAEDKFKEINAAYEILGNEDKRHKYDQYGDSMFEGQNFQDVDIDELFKQFRGFGGGGRGGFNSGFNFNEPDLDISAKITISFKTAILGGTESVTLSNETFNIKIPAGIKSGEKMRVANKGKNYQGKRGNLILEVNINESDEYEREDDDLTKNIDIPLKIALFGGKIDVVTLEKTITLKIPENCKSNQKFRVKELGVLNRRTKEKGALYLKANIILPKTDTLDDKLIEILKEHLPE